MQDRYDEDGPALATLRRARTIGTNLLGVQMRKQAALLGENVADFAETLSEVGAEFEQRGRGSWITPACDYLATNVNRVAGYLRSTDDGAFVEDFTRYATRRPAIVGAAALASGFVLARVMRVTIADGARHDVRSARP